MKTKKKTGLKSRLKCIMLVLVAVSGSFCLLISISCTGHGTTEKARSGDYPIQPVPFTAVKMTDDFWAPRIRINHDITIPIALKHCYATGRIDNFMIAGKLKEGVFSSDAPFDDSDVYKIIEGASYSLQSMPDPALESRIDTLIDYIQEAQEPDGYLYTYRTIHPDKPHGMSGKERWLETINMSHELYNVGHLYEAAVAHYLATGKRSLLDVAIKNANLVDQVFGWGKLELWPGHQEIEIGLAKLYRVTGEKRYLDLAKFFLDVRATHEPQNTYAQSHKPVIKQDEAVGHSVRAVYMYSGMADVAALTGNEDYIKAIDRIWHDINDYKLYITGGIGAAGGHEGFGDKYELPNRTAYCETCASIGNVFWNHRMFMLHGKSDYYDILERTLYNGLIAGIQLTGDRFFYPNPLESQGGRRSEWFGCACCPSNVSRFIPSLPGYIYNTEGDNLYVNLYASNKASFKVGEKDIEFSQETNYPWEGKVSMKFGHDCESRINLKLRVPGWAQNKPIPSDLYTFEGQKNQGKVSVSINGKSKKVKVENGYISLNRKWKADDVIVLELPMDIHRVKANEAIIADRGRFAIQRGPIVYCLEGCDNKDNKVLNLMVEKNPSFMTSYNPGLLGGIQTITGKAHTTSRTLDKQIVMGEEQPFTAIPYFAWANRTPAEMMVWIPDDKEFSSPAPAPTIAGKSKISASHQTRTLEAVKDQYEPVNSDDHTVNFYHWWPKNSSKEWIRYDFAEPAEVSVCKVYWFDDSPRNGGCRVPESWKLFYLDDKGNWKEVKTKDPHSVDKDKYVTVLFDKVKTSAMKLDVQLPEKFSSGVHEWIIE